jgi:hypothetical protein
MGIVTKKSAFEALQNKYLQQGHPALDAYSLAVGDLKSAGEQGKKKLFKDIPNIQSLYEREKKPADILPTGA